MDGVNVGRPRRLDNRQKERAARGCKRIRTERSENSPAAASATRGATKQTCARSIPAPNRNARADRAVQLIGVGESEKARLLRVR